MTVLQGFSGGSPLSEFFTTEETERSGRNGMNDDARVATRNPWPIIRFLAHSRPWSSSRSSVTLGEKPKSATLRAKECERNRSGCRCRLALLRSRYRRLSQTFRFYSSNRGAADLGFFAVGNEWHLSGKVREWRKRRIIGRIRRRWSGCSVPYLSVDFRAFRSKKTIGVQMGCQENPLKFTVER